MLQLAMKTEIHVMVLLHSFSSRVTQINTCLRSTHSAALMQYKNAQHEQNSKSLSLLSMNYVTEMTIPGDCNDYDHNLRESRFRSIENGRKWLCDFDVVDTGRSFYAYYVPELRICVLADWKSERRCIIDCRSGVITDMSYITLVLTAMQRSSFPLFLSEPRKVGHGIIDIRLVVQVDHHDSLAAAPEKLCDLCSLSSARHFSHSSIIWHDCLPTEELR